MKNDTSWVLQDENFNEHFGFMFEQGYEVYSAEKSADGIVWEVVLRKQDLFVKVYAERGSIDISFRTNTQSSDEFTYIGSVVYASTGEKIVPSIYWGMEEHAKLLQKHLDKIEAYYGSEFVKNENNLNSVQKEYHEAISPKDAKIIPILYYPLMWIVIILLVGVLTTLYMVLLDRLFSVLSFDADAYRIVMGVVSLLLAVGTMLLFRRRKKG